MPTCVINRRLDAQLVFSRSRPSATEKKKSRRGRAAWLNQRLRSPGRRRHFRAAPHRRATLDMGKGGDASANGPKVSSKGLNPDRQYTQIRGQVRARPRVARRTTGGRVPRSFAHDARIFKMARAGRADDRPPTPPPRSPRPRRCTTSPISSRTPGIAARPRGEPRRDHPVRVASRPPGSSRTLKTLPKVGGRQPVPRRGLPEAWTLPSTAASSSAL